MWISEGSTVREKGSSSRMSLIKQNTYLTATSLTARQINRRVILNIIHRNQPISRADTARHTGLQRSTVSLIVD